MPFNFKALYDYYVEENDHNIYSQFDDTRMMDDMNNQIEEDRSLAIQLTMQLQEEDDQYDQEEQQEEYNVEPFALSYYWEILEIE